MAELPLGFHAVRVRFSVTNFVSKKIGKRSILYGEYELYENRQKFENVVDFQCW